MAWFHERIRWTDGSGRKLAEELLADRSLGAGWIRFLKAVCEKKRRSVGF